MLDSESFCVISFIHIHSFVLFQITWPKLIQKLNPRAIELDSQRPLLKSDSGTNNGCNIYILIALNLIKRSSLFWFFFSFQFNLNLTFLYFTTKFIK